MAERESDSIGVLNIGDGNAKLVSGSATTRAGVLAECPADIPDSFGIGTVYLSTAGKMYLRVAAAGAETDFEKVTTTAAD